MLRWCGISVYSFIEIKNALKTFKIAPIGVFNSQKTWSCSALFICAVMQHIHWYIEEHMACCIDSQCLSTALCSRMQSSGPARDSRREPSVSKFSSHRRNTAAAAIINGLSTSQPCLPSLRPGPRRWRDCISSPPFPSDWTVPTPLQGSSGELDTVCCNDRHLCPLQHALMQASSARALSWGHRYIKMTLWRPSFITLLRFCCSPPDPL